MERAKRETHAQRHSDSDTAIWGERETHTEREREGEEREKSGKRGKRDIETQRGTRAKRNQSGGAFLGRVAGVSPSDLRPVDRFTPTQDCATGSNATDEQNECGEMDAPCCHVPCPYGCVCAPQDQLANDVHVRCSGDAWLVEQLPDKVSRLRVTNANAVDSGLFASRLRGSAALADRLDQNPIILTVDSTLLPDDPEIAALASAATQSGSTEQTQNLPAAQVLRRLCAGADTALPSSLRVVVCSGKDDCSNSTSNDASFCMPGSFATPDGSGCRECDRGGFFLEDSGKVGWHSHCTCNKCNNGTFSAATGASDQARDCRVCPPGTDTSAEARYRACPCLPDSSRTDRFGPCSTCEGIRGINCTQDSRRTESGFWWQFQTPEMQAEYNAFSKNLELSYDYDRGLSSYSGSMPPVYACPQKDNCLGGIDSACTAGTTGPLCELCAADFFRINGGCSACPSSSGASMAASFAVVLLVLAVGFFVLRSNARSISEFLEESAQDAKKAAVAQVKIRRRASISSRRPSSASDTGSAQGGEHLSPLAAYELQVKMAMADGSVKERGLVFLAQSRVKLGVSERQHAEIMEEARQTHDAKPWFFVRPLTLFKITVQFTQVFGMLTTVYSGIQWSDSYRSFSNTVQILSSNPFQIVLPACMSSSFSLDGYTQFRLAVLLPLIGNLAIGMYYKARSFFVEGESAYCNRHTCTSGGCTNHKEKADEYCGGVTCRGVQQHDKPAEDNICLHASNQRSCAKPRMVTGIRLLRAVCISTAALLYFLIYPTITVNSVRILAECHELCTDQGMSNCTSYMRSDYSITCDTGIHTAYFSVAVITFVLVAIGTPALLAHFLWKNRADFLKSSPDSLHYDPLSTPSALVLGLGFFYTPFKSSLIFWEAVELTYKLSLTSIITFIAPGTTLQVYAGIVIAGFFWMVDAFYQPFDNRAENALQGLAQGVIFLTLSIGGMLQTSSADSANAEYKTARVNEDAASAILILVNASVFVAVAALIWLNRPKKIMDTIKRRVSFSSSMRRPGTNTTVEDNAGGAAGAVPDATVAATTTMPPGAAPSEARGSTKKGGKKKSQRSSVNKQPAVHETTFAAPTDSSKAGGSADGSDAKEESFVGFGNSETEAAGGYLAVEATASTLADDTNTTTSTAAVGFGNSETEAAGGHLAVEATASTLADDTDTTTSTAAVGFGNSETEATSTTVTYAGEDATVAGATTSPGVAPTKARRSTKKGGKKKSERSSINKQPSVHETTFAAPTGSSTAGDNADGSDAKEESFVGFGNSETKAAGGHLTVESTASSLADLTGLATSTAAVAEGDASAGETHIIVERGAAF